MFRGWMKAVTTAFSSVFGAAETAKMVDDDDDDEEEDEEEEFYEDEDAQTSEPVAQVSDCGSQTDLATPCFHDSSVWESIDSPMVSPLEAVESHLTEGSEIEVVRKMNTSGWEDLTEESNIQGIMSVEESLVDLSGPVITDKDLLENLQRVFEESNKDTAVTDEGDENIPEDDSGLMDSLVVIDSDTSGSPTDRKLLSCNVVQDSMVVIDSDDDSNGLIDTTDPCEVVEGRVLTNDNSNQMMGDQGCGDFNSTEKKDGETCSDTCPKEENSLKGEESVDIVSDDVEKSPTSRDLESSGITNDDSLQVIGDQGCGDYNSTEKKDGEMCSDTFQETEETKKKKKEIFEVVQGDLEKSPIGDVKGSVVVNDDLIQVISDQGCGDYSSAEEKDKESWSYTLPEKEKTSQKDDEPVTMVTDNVEESDYVAESVDLKKKKSEIPAVDDETMQAGSKKTKRTGISPQRKRIRKDSLSDNDPPKGLSTEKNKPISPKKRVETQEEHYLHFVHRKTEAGQLIYAKKLIYQLGYLTNICYKDLEAAIINQYNVAVRNRQFGWIRDCRYHAEILFSPKWIDENLPHGQRGKRNQDWKRKKQRASSRAESHMYAGGRNVMCHDIRLQSDPTLCIVRENAAEDGDKKTVQSGSVGDTMATGNNSVSIEDEKLSSKMTSKDKELVTVTKKEASDDAVRNQEKGENDLTVVEHPKLSKESVKIVSNVESIYQNFEMMEVQTAPEAAYFVTLGTEEPSCVVPVDVNDAAMKNRLQSVDSLTPSIKHLVLDEEIRDEVIDSLKDIGKDTLVDKLEVQKDITLGDKLEVKKDITLGDKLEVQKDITLGDKLEVQKDITLGNKLEVQKDITLGDKLEVQKDMTLGDKLEVQKDIILGGKSVALFDESKVFENQPKSFDLLQIAEEKNYSRQPLQMCSDAETEYIQEFTVHNIRKLDMNSGTDATVDNVVATDLKIDLVTMKENVVTADLKTDLVTAMENVVAQTVTCSNTAYPTIVGKFNENDSQEIDRHLSCMAHVSTEVDPSLQDKPKENENRNDKNHDNIHDTAQASTEVDPSLQDKPKENKNRNDKNHDNIHDTAQASTEVDPSLQDKPKENKNRNDKNHDNIHDTAQASTEVDLSLQDKPKENRNEENHGNRTQVDTVVEPAFQFKPTDNKNVIRTSHNKITQESPPEEKLKENDKSGNKNHDYTMQETPLQDTPKETKCQLKKNHGNTTQACSVTLSTKEKAKKPNKKTNRRAGKTYDKKEWSYSLEGHTTENKNKEKAGNVIKKFDTTRQGGIDKNLADKDEMKRQSPETTVATQDRFQEKTETEILSQNKIKLKNVVPHDKTKEKTETLVASKDTVKNSSEMDVAPQNKTKKHPETDVTPQEKTKKKSETNVAPEDKTKRKSQTNVAPQDITKKKSEMDLSSIDKTSKNTETDVAPQGKTKHNTATDLSSQEKTEENTKMDIDNQSQCKTIKNLNRTDKISGNKMQADLKSRHKSREVKSKTHQNLSNKKATGQEKSEDKTYRSKKNIGNEKWAMAEIDCKITDKIEENTERNLDSKLKAVDEVKKDVEGNLDSKLKAVDEAKKDAEGNLDSKLKAVDEVKKDAEGNLDSKLKAVDEVKKDADRNDTENQFEDKAMENTVRNNTNLDQVLQATIGLDVRLKEKAKRNGNKIKETVDTRRLATGQTDLLSKDKTSENSDRSNIKLDQATVESDLPLIKSIKEDLDGTNKTVDNKTRATAEQSYQCKDRTRENTDRINVNIDKKSQGSTNSEKNTNRTDRKLYNKTQATTESDNQSQVKTKKKTKRTAQNVIPTRQSGTDALQVIVLPHFEEVTESSRKCRADIDFTCKKVDLDGKMLVSSHEAKSEAIDLHSHEVGVVDPISETINAPCCVDSESPDNDNKSLQIGGICISKQKLDTCTEDSVSKSHESVGMSTSKLNKIRDRAGSQTAEEVKVDVVKETSHTMLSHYSDQMNNIAEGKACFEDEKNSHHMQNENKDANLMKDVETTKKFDRTENEGQNLIKDADVVLEKEQDIFEFESMKRYVEELSLKQEIDEILTETLRKTTAQLSVSQGLEEGGAQSCQKKEGLAQLQRCWGTEKGTFVQPNITESSHDARNVTKTEVPNQNTVKKLNSVPKLDDTSAVHSLTEVENHNITSYLSVSLQNVNQTDNVAISLPIDDNAIIASQGDGMIASMQQIDDSVKFCDVRRCDTDTSWLLQASVSDTNVDMVSSSHGSGNKDADTEYISMLQQVLPNVASLNEINLDQGEATPASQPDTPVDVRKDAEVNEYYSKDVHKSQLEETHMSQGNQTNQVSVTMDNTETKSTNTKLLENEKAKCRSKVFNGNTGNLDRDKASTELCNSKEKLEAKFVENVKKESPQVTKTGNLESENKYSTASSKVKNSRKQHSSIPKLLDKNEGSKRLTRKNNNSLADDISVSDEKMESNDNVQTKSLFTEAQGGGLQDVTADLDNVSTALSLHSSVKGTKLLSGPSGQVKSKNERDELYTCLQDSAVTKVELSIDTEKSSVMCCKPTEFMVGSVNGKADSNDSNANGVKLFFGVSNEQSDVKLPEKQLVTTGNVVKLQNNKTKKVAIECDSDSVLSATVDGQSEKKQSDKVPAAASASVGDMMAKQKLGQTKKNVKANKKKQMRGNKKW